MEQAEESRSAIPIVSVVGKSDSGKTTFLEGLIAALVGRGWRVATVKHHVHDFDIDVPGKDSYRHARAGARVTMISSPVKFGLIREVDHELGIDEIAREAGDVDILITEGFKRLGRNRIEVTRAGRSTEMICGPSELFAVVSDHVSEMGDVPTFAMDDYEGVADLVERTFLAPGVRAGAPVAGGGGA